jgi:hypothetical protein
MRDTWRRFLKLDQADRKIVLEAAAALFATWAGLRLFGFRRWKEISERLARAKNRSSRDAGETPTDLELAERITRLVRATERRLIFRVNCLERSMALFWLCCRRGIPATLRFGARKHGSQVEAHAWIEVAGNVMNAADGSLPDFVAFDGPISFPETQIH